MCNYANGKFSGLAKILVVELVVGSLLLGTLFDLLLSVHTVAVNVCLYSGGTLYYCCLLQAGVHCNGKEDFKSRRQDGAMVAVA